MPVWNAATRSGEASFGGARSDFAIAAHFLRQLERAGIDLAAWPARQRDGVGDRVFYAVISELIAQEIVERLIRDCLRIRCRRADDKHELAACLKRFRLACEPGERPARHLLVQLGQLAADCGFA